MLRPEPHSGWISENPGVGISVKDTDAVKPDLRHALAM